MPRKNTIADIYARIDSSGDGCHLWTGSCFTGSGYGQVYWKGKNRRVHRLVWELANGPIPPDVLLCHTCSANYPPGDITYRRCCRLDHMYPGTSLSNAQDRSQDGRERPQSGDAHHSRRHPEKMKRGSENPMARLTDDQVREIRIRRAAGAFLKDIAREYHVCEGLISQIARGKIWRHLA